MGGTARGGTGAAAMILGTAGHIDHGKTALVRALTGVNTDRLPEERRRGITIELGYAPLAVEGVGTVGIVDVPGHEAFVRTMLAGATGIDLALIVIAADEGVMPQTREHLAILALLGVSVGVVALTKSDIVDPDWLDLVEADAREALAGGPFRDAPIVPCSARTGEGLDRLRSAIHEATRLVPARASADLFRMPIDRVFTVKGTGTVVTGTIWSGSLTLDETVDVVPRGPTAVRVRSIESHGLVQARAASGARTAVALAGVDRDEVSPRGATLVKHGDPWAPGTLLRADVALMDDAPTIGPRTRVRFHLGTADLGARLVAVGGALTAGRRAPVRVALDGPVVARAGDRFVIRIASPAATIGGGIVTDPSPPRRRSRPFPTAGATPGERLRLILAEAAGHGIPADSLPVRIGVRPGDAEASAAAVRAVMAGGRYYDRAVLDLARKAARAAIADHHRRHPLEPGIPMQALRVAIRADDAIANRVIEQLAASGHATVTDGAVARAGWSVGGEGHADAERIERVLDALREAGTQPPSVDELADALGRDTLAILKLLARRGDAIAVTADRYFAAEALGRLKAAIVAALAGSSGRTASELREATGLTRKYLIPVLEYLDREGVTLRTGDLRVAGPRAEGGGGPGARSGRGEPATPVP